MDILGPTTMNIIVFPFTGIGFWPNTKVPDLSWHTLGTKPAFSCGN